MQTRKWLHRYELSVLVAVFAIVAGTWGFIELADEVADQETYQFDNRVVHALRNPSDPSLPLGPEWLSNAAQNITSLGSYAVLALVTAIVFGFLLLQRKPGGAWLILVAATGGSLINSFLKIYFARSRPDIPHTIHVATASFPSGHAMLSAIIYLSLGAMLARLTPGRTIKVYVIAVSMFVSFLVGVSRIYLGVHYPTDVLAGWSAGLAWAMLCWLVAWYMQKRGAVESDSSRCDS